MSLKEKIEWLDDSYGVVAKWIWRIVFYPICALIFYSSTAYLNTHYVSKSDFDSYKEIIVSENKASFDEVNKKLDLLLLRDASGAEKFADFERRITRLENNADQK